MGHEINKTDKFGEVRSNGLRAWHGLGDPIPEGLTAAEGFERLGLGWRTNLVPIFADLPAGVDADGRFVSQRVEVKGYRAHLREDTGETLGVVSDGYRSLENMDLARFADSLAGADAAITVETAGSLHSGRRIFACVKLPEVVKASAADVMEQYVLVSNGHGGFASFSCYPTSVRVVCANTLRWSERDAARGMSFIHLGGSMEERLKLARTALGVARQETVKFQEQVDALVRSNVSVEKAKTLARECYDLCFGKIEEAGADSDSTKRALERRESVLSKWIANLENERQQVAGIKGSKWALYNAISEWHDHERGFAEDGSNARVSSNLFGVSQKDKLKVYRKILASV